MAYIVCRCGHKTIKPTQRTTCPACGAPFAQPTAGQGAQPASSASNAGQSWSASNSPVPYGQQQQQWGGQRQQQWSPIPFSQPAAATPIPTPFNQPIPIHQAVPTNTITYPSGFPHRPPELVGKLITFDRDTIDIPTDWSHIVLRVLFFPFIFPGLLKNFFGNNPQPKQTMTVYRVQVELSPGNTRSALLKGDLQRDKPRLGQRVAFWGHDENGVLAISHGYNEDTKAEISATYPGHSMLQFTRAAAIGVPALLLLLIILFPAIIPFTINALGMLIGAVIGTIIAGIVLYVLISMFLPWLPKKLVSIIVYVLLFFALLTMCSSMLARIH